MSWAGLSTRIIITGEVMNLLFAAAFFRNRRKKLEEKNKILKDKIGKCPKNKGDVNIKTCSKCKYFNKIDSDKEKLLCKY